ncbi:YhjD/YihY/BrkB family envelope integrity protein [Jiangella rhizosphaerae]|uniref:YhjD/YihY/BrkB family envelope integrity protein n=1 Tax=Jiangella rhizosphaerae TaxID=2293569 RepID=UPI0011C3DBA3|nr:YhjD/YihY/BrkB family envelope integrity protein [Jiangella rhizosphaerae]
MSLEENDHSRPPEPAASALPRAPARLLGRWPGRVVVRTAAGCVRIDVFDRAMTVAAQAFSSVLPILILFATWAGASATEATAEALRIPDESRSMFDDAVQGASGAAFGVVGGLIVLISATSLSRAVTRAFTAVWELPRPRNRLRSAWRWLAAVVGLALSVLVVRELAALAGGLPQPRAWQVVTVFAADTAVALFLPWVLLAGAVRPRSLLPGALLFALAMLVLRPASGVWLPRALEASADRFGAIGVAFTYLAWLYAVSFCFLVAAVAGRAIATDDGWLGRRIRGV